MSEFLLVSVIISCMIFFWLRLDTFFGLLDILFFRYSALLAFISPYSFFVFRFNFILPDKQRQHPICNTPRKKRLLFSCREQARTPSFQTCRTSLRSRFNKPKSRFSAALRHIKPACRHPIRVPSLQTALRLFKAHAAVSSRLQPAYSNSTARRIKRSSHRSPRFAAFERYWSISAAKSPQKRDIAPFIANGNTRHIILASIRGFHKCFLTLSERFCMKSLAFKSFDRSSAPCPYTTPATSKTLCSIRTAT